MDFDDCVFECIQCIEDCYRCMGEGCWVDDDVDGFFVGFVDLVDDLVFGI